MSDPKHENSDNRIRRAFSALNILLEQVNQKLNEVNKELAAAKDELVEQGQRIAKLEGHREGVRDGRDDTLAGVKEIHKEAQEDKKIGVEKLKATAPVIIALITGVFGAVAGLIALIQAIITSGRH